VGTFFGKTFFLDNICSFLKIPVCGSMHQLVNWDFTSAYVFPLRCANPLQFCHRFLDLTGPLQVGGLPSLPTDFQVQSTHFVGCIRDVYIDESMLDLDAYMFNHRTETGCGNKRSFCKNALCKNEGMSDVIILLFNSPTWYTLWGKITCLIRPHLLATRPIFPMLMNLWYKTTWLINRFAGRRGGLISQGLLCTELFLVTMLLSSTYCGTVRVCSTVMLGLFWSVLRWVI
jgi:hypothetical protein